MAKYPVYPYQPLQPIDWIEKFVTGSRITYPVNPVYPVISSVWQCAETLYMGSDTRITTVFL